MIDLHTHSTCSDGTLTPEALAEAAGRAGLFAAALTDHDTVEGVQAFGDACRRAGLLAVAGVEISVDHGPGTFHLLGYHVDPDCRRLNDTLAWIREERASRNRRILERLESLGLSLTQAEVDAEVPPDNVNIGRPHVAAAMVRKGYVHDLPEAFSLYLGKGCAAYVARGKLGPEEAIGLIRESGGVPVLAHPFTLAVSGSRPLSDLVAEWAAAGLQGVECYYPEHGPSGTRRYLDLARRHDLVATGGTDFHGAPRPGIALGVGDGTFSVPDEVIARLAARRARSGDPTRPGST